MAERKVIVLISLTLLSVASFIHCILEIIPERASIDYFNEKYVQTAKLYIRKTGRGGLYVVHFDFTTNVTMANNVTVHAVTYEYLHNEYKRSFIEVHPRLCDMIDKAPFVAVAARNAGLGCPILPNEYHLRNITFAVPEVQNMKWVFPFEQAMLRVTCQQSDTNETLGHGYITFVIRQSKKKPQS